jgi:hypothetical protein
MYGREHIYIYIYIYIYMRKIKPRGDRMSHVRAVLTYMCAGACMLCVLRCVCAYIHMYVLYICMCIDCIQDKQKKYFSHLEKKKI